MEQRVVRHELQRIQGAGYNSVHLVPWPVMPVLDTALNPWLMLSQGLLAALASAVASLEAATADLNTTTLQLGPLLNATYGPEAAQAEVSGAAAATTAYQVRVQGSFCCYHCSSGGCPAC
jgi:hypothetical protein